MRNGTANGPDVVAFLQRGAAHHLDLRTPNPADPEDVRTGRAMARAAIVRWSNAALAAAGQAPVYAA